MSAPHFDMAATWDDQHVAPQLEQEYGFGPSLFGGMLPANITQQTGRRQAPAPSTQNPPFSAFGSSYSQNVQPEFNFNVQPSQQQAQGVNMSHNGASYFPQVHRSQGSPQRSTQQYHSPNDIYSGHSPHQDQLDAFHNASYPSYPQQGMNMRSGASQPVASSSSHNYDVGPSQASDPMFSSPGMSMSHTFSPDLDMGSSATYIGAARDEVEYPNPYKRPRPIDDAGLFEIEPEGDADDAGPMQGDAGKPRPTGACARCKHLKVKCDFKNDPDTCKRCRNGGHECVIPGRKKRRPPPKREHLLTQIREQASTINALMAQLEEANRKAEETRDIRYNAPSPSAVTTTTESFSLISSRITSPEIEGDGTEATRGEVTKTRAEVQDWISKARESFAAFGGYINMGGPSVLREELAGEEEDDQEDLDDENADGIRFDIQEADGGDGEDGEDGLSGDEGSVHTSRRSVSEAPLRKPRLAIIPNPAAPIGLFADLQLGSKSVRRVSSRSTMADEEDKEEDVGLANVNYFSATPNPERPILTEEHQPPHILRCGLVSPAEVEKLFGIYWNYMNVSLSLLDPVLYTAQKTYWRSPFLFTVICGIASRFYSDRPELYQQAMHFARLAAGTALIGGQKNVESVHAYILLALYPVPARKWEEDRSWIYLGVAIRIATDLNLHHPNTAKPRNEAHAREMLNRTRAWINCFNLDRSTSSQYGKSPIISNVDYVANRSGEWWNSSEYNMRNFDIQLAGYNAELTVLGTFRGKIHSDANSPTGFNKNLDIAALASQTDDELAQLWEHWSGQIRAHTDAHDKQNNFRTGLLRLAYSYARMTVLSFGFQYAFGKTSVGQDVTLLFRCLRAAFDVLKAVLEDIAVPDQKIFLRHGPEAQSVFITFACAFLLKLMQPRYANYVSREQRVEIRDKVQRVVDLLGSPEVAVDERHGPKLYSSFLKSLLDSPGAQIDRPPPTQRRLMAKSKSVSPTIQKSNLQEDVRMLKQTASSTPVTPALIRQSVSPEPESKSILSGVYSATSPETSDLLPPSGLGMDVSESLFFSPPLPYDPELLQTMTDPNIWPEVAMPGFAWMGGYQQGSNDMN